MSVPTTVPTATATATATASPAPAVYRSIADSYYLPYSVPCNAYALPLAATMNVSDYAGGTPAATLAPNYVYQSTAADGTPKMCFTETLGAGSIMDPACSGANSIVSCAQNTGLCADALSRGLLSPLTPMLSGGNDSVFQYKY